MIDLIINNSSLLLGSLSIKFDFVVVNITKLGIDLKILVLYLMKCNEYLVINDDRALLEIILIFLQYAGIPWKIELFLTKEKDNLFDHFIEA